MFIKITRRYEKQCYIKSRSYAQKADKNKNLFCTRIILIYKTRCYIVMLFPRLLLLTRFRTSLKLSYDFRSYEIPFRVIRIYCPRVLRGQTASRREFRVSQDHRRIRIGNIGMQKPRKTWKNTDMRKRNGDATCVYLPREEDAARDELWSN